MTRRAGIARLLIVTLGCATAVAGLGALPATARVAAPGPAPAVIRQAGTHSQVVLGPAPATPTVVGEVPDVPDNGDLHASVVAPRWNVHYDAGFNANPAAKTAFQAAVDQWSKLIYSPVPIEIDASFTALPPGVLGSAGPISVVRNFSGATQSSTWYPVALANALHGSDLVPNDPNVAGSESDIDAQFSSSYSNFYFGTDGHPGTKVDFESVVMHELGHGLGFLGAMDVSGGLGTCCFAGSPLIYDRFTTSNGTGLLTLPDNSSQLATALQGQDVRFTGSAATAANGAVSPKLYAPASWQPGSSYSHLDEATYPAGNANSLMTPAIGSSEVIHSPGPITLGIFTDSGWTLGGLPRLSIGGSLVVEGNAGTRSLRFTVSLSNPVAWDVSVHYATGDITATSPSDYGARSGTVTIPAGSTSNTVAVVVKGDTLSEPTERFKVVLSAPSGALLTGTSVSGYIQNDEPSSGVSLSVGNATVVEGNTGTRKVAVTVSLSKAAATSVSVHWATGTGSATSGVDYTPASGTLTIAAGITYGRILVNVLPDGSVEPTETVPVTLSSPTNATIYRATGSASIGNDD